jgi:hypothetical protein
MAEGRVDYRLQRRVALDNLSLASRALEQHCDAHPELLRAAKHLGEPRGEDCPVCGEVELVGLHYVFLQNGPKSQGGTRRRARAPRPLRRAAWGPRRLRGRGLPRLPLEPSGVAAHRERPARAAGTA